MKKLLAVALALCISLKLFAPGHYETVPEVWHNNAWHPRQKLFKSGENYFAIDSTKGKLVTLTPEEVRNQGLSHGAVGYVDTTNSKFVALTPEELAISDAKQRKIGHYPGEAFDSSTWFSGAWHSNSMLVGNDYLVPVDKPIEGDGQRYIKEGGSNRWNKVVTLTPDEITISDSKNKVWHDGKWHDARWNITRNAQAYIIGDGKPTDTMFDKYYVLAPGEMAVSDAKRRLWHNGTWHDRIWKGNVQGYFQDGKFIAMTPDEITTSDAKNQ